MIWFNLLYNLCYGIVLILMNNDELWLNQEWDHIRRKSGMILGIAYVCHNIVFHGFESRTWSVKIHHYELWNGGSWWIMVDHGGSWWIMVDHSGSWWIMVDHGGPWWIMVDLWIMLITRKTRMNHGERTNWLGTTWSSQKIPVAARLGVTNIRFLHTQTKRKWGHINEDLGSCNITQA